MNYKELEKIKQKALEEHIPIIMDDTLEVIEKYLKKEKPTSLLEIGTAVGYSAICFSEFLAENGEIDTIERDTERIQEAKENIKKAEVDKKINIYEGDAVEILPTMDKKYDAVFVAIGANIPAKMNVEGENLNGVYGGNYLLEYNKHPNYTGKKVAIIGGGNVAMDSARTIKKLGASEVYVIYRRAEEQMPAEKKEIADAKKEGIEFLFQTNIVKILGKEKVEKLECIKTELVKKEGENRLSPVNIEGSNFILDMDYVVMATGSKPENNIIEKFERNEYGYIKIDENMQTSINKVFAGGDIVGQKATVAWASRSGRDAAEKILKIACNIM